MQRTWMSKESSSTNYVHESLSLKIKTYIISIKYTDCVFSVLGAGLILFGGRQAQRAATFAFNPKLTHISFSVCHFLAKEFFFKAELLQDEACFSIFLLFMLVLKITSEKYRHLQHARYSQACIVVHFYSLYNSHYIYSIFLPNFNQIAPLRCY